MNLPRPPIPGAPGTQNNPMPHFYQQPHPGAGPQQQINARQVVPLPQRNGNLPPGMKPGEVQASPGQPSMQQMGAPRQMPPGYSQPPLTDGKPQYWHQLGSLKEGESSDLGMPNGPGGIQQRPQFAPQGQQHMIQGMMQPRMGQPGGPVGFHPQNGQRPLGQPPSGPAGGAQQPTPVAGSMPPPPPPGPARSSPNNANPSSAPSPKPQAKKRSAPVDAPSPSKKKQKKEASTPSSVPPAATPTPAPVAPTPASQPVAPAPSAQVPPTTSATTLDGISTDFGAFGEPPTSHMGLSDMGLGVPDTTMMGIGGDLDLNGMGGIGDYNFDFDLDVLLAGMPNTYQEAMPADIDAFLNESAGEGFQS
ncbi:hypothetical protein BT69DRAFT_1129930 [Atractiella rhizophila]|nr:hypothetical protein BT69DRAFT_1129930 [Atractiella rhizophila]